jgi:starch synthase
MPKLVSILYITSELYPFAKVGGLADVAYSLSLALREKKNDMRVMIPKYGCVSERKNRIHEINRLKDLPIKIGDNTELVTVKSSAISNPRSKVQAYISTNANYFDSKKGIYSDPKTGIDYPDNDERFILFARSVIDTCIVLNWFPDIIHCNDWQTALVPGYARTLFPNKFRKTKIVLTIHNFSQQGIFPLKTFDKTGLPPEAQIHYKEKNNINFLKGAIYYSDAITTVSKSYALEILNEKKKRTELNDLLLDRKSRFTGILNGIDIWSWNPKRDIKIKKQFSNNFYDYKNTNKAHVLQKFGLQYNENIPLIAIVTRLDSQKGLSLLVEAAEKLFALDIQLILLGEGNPELRKEIGLLAKKYFNKFKVKFAFDEQLAHQIEAGSDMFLMPSLIEPCGLNAMYSLAYGSIPIVRATGGLKDIVNDYDFKTKTGNGFVFNEYKPESMIDAIKKAISIYKNKEEWEILALKGMNEDYSWAKSIEEYQNIYSSLFKD